ncbi:MAG: hypothetical protein ACLUNQ_09535 [Oscillospiraceae bacterium]
MTCIEEIMDPDVVSVTTLDDKEDVAQAMSKYDYLGHACGGPGKPPHRYRYRRRCHGCHGGRGHRGYGEDGRHHPHG